MKVQCPSCGFSGIFIGSIPPINCQVCKVGKLSQPVATNPCEQCDLPYPVTSVACPQCKLERITRSNSKENNKRPVPDTKKSS